MAFYVIALFACKTQAHIFTETVILIKISGTGLTFKNRKKKSYEIQILGLRTVTTRQLAG